MSFLEQLERSAASRSLLSPPAATQSQSGFVTDIRAVLPDVDEPVRTMRIHQVQMLSFHAAAARERAITAGEDVTPFGLFVSTIIDACIGYFTAPMSDETSSYNVPIPATQLQANIALKWRPPRECWPLR